MVFLLAPDKIILTHDAVQFSSADEITAFPIFEARSAYLALAHLV